MGILTRGSIAAAIVSALGLLGVLAVAANRELASVGADGLLHPARHPMDAEARASHPTTMFDGAGVTLEGWRFPASGRRRGSVVYLHGVADNRASASGAAARFVARGFDVVAYDSRAHGGSGGEACTYGFNEKHDLERVLDVLAPGPVVIIGTSLGAAVALQAAANDARITTVVAAESFSDLRTVATERAPWFFPRSTIRDALALAEARARFQIAAVSPVLAASRIHVPVLLVHGELDRETPADHSRRIFAALHARKRLLIVPAAGHNESLRSSTWPVIEEWVDSVLMSGDR